MIPAEAAPGPDAGRVLRLALVAWGLGHLALGRRLTGGLLLAAEVAALAALVALTLALVGTTLQLVAFVAGNAFVLAWAWQAVAAYRAAHAARDADRPVPQRSPAAAIAWLALPLLAWFSGFWLLPAEGSTAASAVDRFVTAWTDDQLAAGAWPPAVTDAADEATERLLRLCRQGRLRPGCEAGGTELFRDVRVRITSSGDAAAVAIAEAVRYERRDTRFLWIFPGTELVPVPIEAVLDLRLEADPEAARPIDLGLGAREWRIVDAEAARGEAGGLGAHA